MPDNGLPTLSGSWCVTNSISQRVLHLDHVSTLTQYRPPPPPTSKRPGYEVLYRSPIDILNDDALLEIFNHLRLDDERGWDLRFQWSKLSHVCRRWRSLIFGSPSYLRMRLPVLNRASLVPMLTHFPPLPLVIDCEPDTRTGRTTMSAVNEFWLPSLSSTVIAYIILRFKLHLSAGASYLYP